MDNRWANLIIVLPRDPLVDECVETGEDGATEPDGVLAGWLVIDMNWISAVLRPLHLIKFVPETTSESIEQRVTTGKNNIGRHLCLHVLLAAHYGLHYLQVESLHASLTA